MPASPNGRNLRVILHSAFAFVRSVEANKALGSVTIDHLIDAQIHSLKQGDVRPIFDATGRIVTWRTSKWDRLEALRDNVRAVVDEVRKAGKDARKLADMGIYEAVSPLYEDESP